MRLQPRAEIAVGAGLAQRVCVLVVGKEFDLVGRHHRRFRWQRAGFFESGGQLAGLDLGGFDIRLVERIDAEDGACHSSRDLEPKEFLADVVDRFHDDANDRMSGLFQRGELVVVGCVGFALGAEVDEEAIAAVSPGVAERLAIDRDQALAILAGRLRDQLFGPGAEIGDFLR